MNFLAGNVRKYKDIKFKKVSLAKIARKCCILEDRLLSALQMLNVQPAMRGEVACFSVSFSSKIILSSQHGKSDVFARGRKGDVGRFLFSIKGVSGEVILFFEKMQRDVQERIWRCTDMIRFLPLNQINDVVSMVHDCRTHGCLRDVFQRLSDLVPIDQSHTKIRKPSDEIITLINSNRSRLHRARGPLFIQNFE